MRNYSCLPLVLFMVACSNQGVNKLTSHSLDDIRQASAQDPSVIQVYPVASSAVQALERQAEAAELRHEYSQAQAFIHQALIIEPKNPELIQHLAELKWVDERYMSAQYLAMKSFELGPQIGQLCSRNWRTVVNARRQMGDSEGASDAQQQLTSCAMTLGPRW